MAMLPFQSLSLSTLNGRKGTYALIRQDENRFRPLVLRRPRAEKLQEQQDAPKPPSPGKGKAKDRSCDHGKFAAAGTAQIPRTRRKRTLIEQKMAQLGTTNMAAYLRKMAIDGFVVNLELPELGELVSLLRRSSNNLNQLTRRVHETGRVYDADMDDLRQSQERLWDAAQKILTSLAKIQ